MTMTPIAIIIKNILSSFKTSILLLSVYSFALAIATLVEKSMSALAAKTIIYYSPIFIMLQALLVLNFVMVSIRLNLFGSRKWGFLIVHAAFIVILLGAFVTHVFGYEGTLHLRTTEKTKHMTIDTDKGSNDYELPFSVELLKFTLTRYPGSSSPSSFESTLLINDGMESYERTVSMNNILDIKGYRLFQASYDKDEKGSILSVNKDIAGRTITYVGYTLLILGFVFCFTAKNSRFILLNKRLKQMRSSLKPLIILFIILLPLSLVGQNKDLFDVVQKSEIDQIHASKFGSLTNQSFSGRMEPVNTFSLEILRKLHKADKIGNLNSDQFLLSLLAMPDMWIHIRFISQKNKEVAFFFDLTEGECAFAELFDTNGNYKLEEELGKIYAKPLSSRTRFDKDVIKLDEQINIFNQLLKYRLLNIFPHENNPNHKWYAAGDDLSQLSPGDTSHILHLMSQYLHTIRESTRTENWILADNALDAISTYQKNKNTTLDISTKKIEAELLYNKLDIFNSCKKFYLILGGLLLAISFTLFFYQNRYLVWGNYVLIFLIIVAFLYHLAGIVMRGYIAGYAPWSNSYETMTFVSLISVIGGFLFAKHSPITLALSTLFAGIMLFVSSLNMMDPQINSLVPVLKSPWLMIHVAVIVAAYGFFGISCLLGLTNLILLLIKKKKSSTMFSMRIQELTTINEMSLLIGLALMTIGTFLGAVWANESWGRYWGWDPKETCALITIVVYTIVTHLHLVSRWNKPLIINVLAIIAFASVLMTYFGVNYYLSGMHSYG